MENKLLSALVCGLGFAVQLHAAIYCVAPPGAGGNDGNSGADWTAPMASISNALSQGDVTEILVSNGTYNLADVVNITKAVAIRSWNNGAVDRDGTIMVGAGTNRCFRLVHADAVVDGFTITNGFCQDGVIQTGDSAWTSGRGGGVFITQAGGMLTNCLVIGNTARSAGAYKGGGGVYLFGGAVWNCRVTGNMVTNAAASSSMGGGVAVYLYNTNNYPTGIVANCEIDNNNIYQNANYGGGGVGVYFAALINNCDIHANYSSGRGGGIFTYGQGVITVTNSRIFNNDTPTGYGGGICVRVAEDEYGVLVTDCLVSNNYAGDAGSGLGGGIHVDSSSTNVMLRNCTVVDNVADRDGGGVYMNAGHMDGGAVYNNECLGANAGGGGICAWAGESNVVFIRNVLINSNRASSTWGGGGVNLRHAWLENCDIRNNFATNGNGGGVFAHGDSTVKNCVIVSNRSFVSGGGVLGGYLLTSGTSIVQHCRIMNNIAFGAGGGVSAAQALVLRNCLITGNTAQNRYGGGIYANNNKNGEISNCTVMDNEVEGDAAFQRGAGILVTDTNTIFNCLVWSNRWTGTLPDQERDLGMYAWPTGGDFTAQSNSVHFCCSPRDFRGARGNITNSPALVDFNGGDYRLAAGSAGINAGTNMPWMFEVGAVDMDGYPRIDRLSRRVDMGCYEYILRGTMFWFQ